MPAYYNENDPFAARWLRDLITSGAIASGVVDERSIRDVTPADLTGFDQCHFFAGIGVWSYALRLAGWPDDRPVWTGSCPCQPFSAAGRGGGVTNERHLWPAWFHLIGECRPPVVYGEQVASKAGLGWFDLVSADLEGSDYTVGANDICSAGVGAPHIRQRLWFVAERLGDSDGAGLEGHAGDEDGAPGRTVASGSASEASGDGRVVDATRSGGGAGLRDSRPGKERGLQPANGSGADRPGPTNGIWRAADWLHCRDGKWRPVEPGTFPLAHGVAARVGRLRAYGNAINPEVAKEFIGAYLDT